MATIGSSGGTKGLMDYIYGGIKSSSTSLNFRPTNSPSRTKTKVEESAPSDAASTNVAMETKSYVAIETDTVAKEQELKNKTSIETKASMETTHSNGKSNEALETKSTTSLESNVSKCGNTTKESVAMETRTTVSMDTGEFADQTRTSKEEREGALVLKRNSASSTEKCESSTVTAAGTSK